MRKALWVDGRSLKTLPVKHDPSMYDLADYQAAKVRSSKAIHQSKSYKRPDRPLITSNPRRDHSRKAVRQSGGYVTSGWRSY
jgi:hypothetical protein